ncbi:TPA: hypothetical protein N3Z13_004571, partial [Klebsiella pneumoniae]
DARKRAYCLKIQPATGSFARNLIYSTKPSCGKIDGDYLYSYDKKQFFGCGYSARIHYKKATNQNNE